MGGLRPEPNEDVWGHEEERGNGWGRGGAAPMLAAHGQIMKVINEDRKPEENEGRETRDRTGIRNGT